ncbi:hypothetical protein [Algoriphagus sediminis]|uniref:Uncharacterized protein n=1 Tax=Algoriphagus sediminis TaxID=3057113 RepID=A0ABT7Y7X0_9BACT|nr:hypothetical protein [Algoriphagus sediminis]MDN3202607.1 hypothetical protein [Algoriphagus sediminis]
MKLDLELWKDKELIKKQNRLKARFWNIFSEVGNEVQDNSLLANFNFSKGIKVSKGNDLIGFPYQVLDIVRNWDEKNGLNIRVLNWFGHGMFLFLYLGHNRVSKHPFNSLIDLGLIQSKNPDPFDYPGILLLNEGSPEYNKKSDLSVWFKEINITDQSEKTQAQIFEEIKGLIEILTFA